MQQASKINPQPSPQVPALQNPSKRPQPIPQQTGVGRFISRRFAWMYVYRRPIPFVQQLSTWSTSITILLRGKFFKMGSSPPLPTRGPWLAPVFVPCTADIFFVRAVAGYTCYLLFVAVECYSKGFANKITSCRHVFIFCEQRQLPSKNFLLFRQPSPYNPHSHTPTQPSPAQI